MNPWENDLFYGIKVVSSPLVQPQPVLKIDPQFKYCSDEFREQMNQWLLEMFGTRQYAYFMAADFGFGKPDILVMNPEQFAVIKNFQEAK